MNKRIKQNTVNKPKWEDIEGSCGIFNLGKNSMRKLAEEAGAVSKVGRRVLINIDKVDAYLQAK